MSSELVPGKRLAYFQHEKGCLFKLLIELVGTKDITIDWSKKGLTIQEPVTKSSCEDVSEMAIFAKCEAKSFGEFVCEEPFLCQVSYRKLRECLKTATKKKAKVALTVSTTDEPHILLLNVALSSVDGSTASENHFMQAIKVVQPLDRWSYPADSLYRPEIAVNAGDLSRIKNFDSASREKTFKIETQVAGKYISIGTYSPGLPGSCKVMGTKITPYPKFARDEEGYVFCDKCKQYLEDCECECELCTVPRVECECACDRCNEWLQNCDCRLYDVTSRSYPHCVILRLSKTVPFKFLVKFAEPKEPNLSLKISFTIVFASSVLGDVKMYVRDVDAIQANVEEEMKKTGAAKAAKAAKAAAKSTAKSKSVSSKVPSAKSRAKK